MIKLLSLSVTKLPVEFILYSPTGRAPYKPAKEEGGHSFKVAAEVTRRRLTKT